MDSGTWLARASRSAVTSRRSASMRSRRWAISARSSSTSLRYGRGRLAPTFSAAARHVHLLHQLQFAGFQFVDFFLVAGDFMADRLVFLVLAGLELLELQPLDRRAAGSGVEFESFQAQFAIDHGVVRPGDGRFVAGQFGLGPGLVLGEFFEVFGERQQAAVPVLENQQRANFI